jgi:hypothetical protein
MPPNSVKDSKAGPIVKQWKKNKIKTHSLTCNTFGVKGECFGAPRWD